MNVNKIPSFIYIYTIPNDIIDELVDVYCDYVTNPYSELRQRDDYWQSRLSVGIGTPNPLPAEYRALKYKYNPQMPNDEEPLVENLPLPRKNALRVHFIALLDIIYERCFSAKDGIQVFNAALLQACFRYYSYVIEVLRFKGVIRGATITGIEIAKPEIFSRQKCKNIQVIADIEAFHQSAYQRWQEEMNEAAAMSSKGFVEKYNKCLNRYTLIDVDGALGEINKDNCESLASELYYHRIIDTFNDIRSRKKEYRGSLENAPDINGRWYHLAARTPRVIRKHTNIKFIVDARNSQLVLFNFFLLDYYLFKDINIYTTFSSFNTNTLGHHLNLYVENKHGLDYGLNHIAQSDRIEQIKDNISSLSKEKLSNHLSGNQQYKTHSKLFYIILKHIYNSRLLSSIYSSNNGFRNKRIFHSSLHKDMQQLHNELKNNGFGDGYFDAVMAIPTDVFRYIYLSSHGLLWDMLAARLEMSRSVIKEKAFGNIFYSYSHTPVPEPEIRDGFKSAFGNVVKVLNYYKRLFAGECDDAGLIKFKTTAHDHYGDMFRARGFIQLPHKLTQLESAIFYDILRELYKVNDVIAIGIHDAIAVIDGIEPQAVIDTMQRVYQSYGLIATFKVE